MGAKFTEWLLAIMFTLVGAIFIIIGIFGAVSTSKFKDNALETTAKVISVSKHTDSNKDISYKVYVYYLVDGTMYSGSYTSSSYVPEGSKKIIYYDRNNPSKMRTSTSSSADLIMSVIGIPFCAVGVGLLISKINKISSKKRAIESGDKIYGDFQEVTINHSYSVNNRHPYIIICKGKDNLTGEMRTFKSENIWDNPEYKIKEKNITTFPIYIDTTNRKKYHLSLENLEME